MKDDIKKRTPFKSAKLLLPALFALAVCALLLSCENILNEIPRKNTGGGYGQDASAEGGSTQAGGADSGTLTVSVRIGEPRASRYAAPSADQKKDFVYAALLYPDGGAPSGDFVSGASDASGATITFLFQKPPLSEGERLTLEIFAFAKGTAETDFPKATALLSGRQSGLEAEGTSLKVDAMSLERNASAPKGTVSLKVKVPDGCALEVDDTANFAIAGTSPNFIVEHAGDGIPAGSYELTFTVREGSETLFPFSDTITVLPGMRTDTWVGLPSSEREADGTRDVSEMAYKTFYVRGEGGWYSAMPAYSTVTASDENPGSFLKPFATIKKAIDTVIARNDGGAYTICVDGTFAAPVDISALDKSLSLTIKALSATATLDAGGNSRVMDIGQTGGASLELTLERLVLTGGSSAGGIRIGGGNVSLTDCEVKGNAGTGVSLLDDGAATLTMAGGEISGNNTAGMGGGVYVGSGCEFTLESGTISGNEAAEYGGGVYVNADATNKGTFTMKGGSVSGNTASGKSYGGGVYIASNGEFMMEDGEINENRANQNGAGVYVSTNASFTMKKGKINGNKEDSSSFTGNGIGLYVDGEFTMEDGEICENKGGAQGLGSGVYISQNGTFMMNGGKINKNSAYPQYMGRATVYSVGQFIMNGGEICENQACWSAGVAISGDGTFIMTDGKISGNRSSDNTGYGGGGVYACGDSFTMSGGEISRNVLSDDSSSSTSYARGGGVYVGCDFTMSGGKIINNRAEDVNARGGGIYLNKGTFTMTGGEISGNSADGYGSGIYVYNSYSPNFIMKGKARVAEDNDVYLDLGYYSSEPTTRACKIQVDGALTAQSPVATITPSDRFGGRQVLEAVGGTITQAVCDQFALSSQSGHEDDEILPDSTGKYGVLKCTSYYVRSPNSSPWYSANCSSASTGNDDHGGSLLNPFRTVQKAIDTIISANDGASEYTIYVDGTFYSSSATIADFNSVTTPLKVKIVGLGDNAQFTGSSSFQPIVAGTSGASKDVSLTLENLKLRESTNTGGRGGAITLYTTASNSHTIRNCEIYNCKAAYGSAIYNEGGSLHLENCTIHDNTTTTSGIVYNGQSSAILTMSDVTFENNTTSNGVVFIANGATVKVSDSSVVIKDNTFTDTSSTAGSRSTGICVWNGIADLSGSAKIDDGIGLYYESDSHIRYVLVSSALTQSPAATITPSSQLYTPGTEVLVAGAGVPIDDDICGRFVITPESDGTEWKIIPSADGSKGVLQPK